MINTNDFKIGQTIKLNNNIYQILDFLHVKPGKGSAFVRSKLKNLKNSDIIEHTFNAGIKIETVFIYKLKLQFSYHLDDLYIFLDMNTYEEIPIAKNKLEHILKYLSELTVIEVLLDEQKEILNVSLPDKVSLKVVDIDSHASSNSSRKNTSYKNAVLETGIIIKVPLFIEKDEKIIINTQTGIYLSRDVKK
ncbi:elongation factor P [Candidatus Phytoplasma pini]|uniref:Elongation factor P n=1 Tax=Candidatus Phytoplasma pini TaxID=267362 RepID=A0A559KJA9_9MOLU|nr:elongation factor P [Candidatus Phytoplasma pini]TVY12210.1 Elongation factor P [Candidatus Phytoplasma pini]